MAERGLIRGGARQLNFLPEAARIFLVRRSIEAGGVVLFVAAAFLAVTLASFSPSDPSLNTATTAPVENWGGYAGALTADLLIQTIGLGAVGLVVIFTAWGWRIVSHQGLPRRWLNLAALPVALVLGAGFAAGLPLPDAWTLESRLGGWIGDSIFFGLAGLLHRSGLGVGPTVLTSALALVTIAFTTAAMGISFEEWRRLFRTVRRGINAIIRFTMAAGRRLLERRKFGEVDEFQTETASRLSRIVAREAGRQQGPGASADAGSAKNRVSRGPAKLKSGRRAAQEREPALDLEPQGEHKLPPLGLLALPRTTERRTEVTDDALEGNARLLESVLDDFGIRGEIINVRPGPVVTLYELEPAPGIKSARVIGLADDIARSMSAVSARVAVIPGRNVIGIELPNTKRETVYLRELLASSAYERTSSKLTLALGKDIGGEPVIADLSTMPHLLIAGTTGSGKSVAINTMILSLLYRMPPDQCKFIMIDPKMLELSVYDGIPHLLAPVVTDPSKAVVALKWTVREMEERYRAMSKLGVRNIGGYNQRLAEARANGEALKRTVQTGFDDETGQPVYEEEEMDLEPMPFIVVIVDEMADLMMVAGKDIEGAVQRLAQMARAAGIHLLMATQRPSVDVITGTIKANFPTRISFQVTSKIDSRTILGEQGAEQLLGQGDMLYMAGGGRLQRVHGPFASDTEVEEIVKFLKKQGEPRYREEVTEAIEGEITADMMGLAGNDGDDLYDKAVALVAHHQKASTSFIQRHLQIGYNRAARIMEQMEEQGVVSPANHVGKREVLIGEH